MKRVIKSSSFNVDPTGEIQAAWDKLEMYGVSHEALSLVTDINGYSVETLNDVARTRFSCDLEDL